MTTTKMLPILLVSMLTAPIAAADTSGPAGWWDLFVSTVLRAGSAMDPNGNDWGPTIDPNGLDAGVRMDDNGLRAACGDYTGCIDPNGRSNGTATRTSPTVDPYGLDQGSSVDPNGVDRGPGIDPDGLDRGFSIDPNGGDDGAGLDPHGGGG